MFSALDNLSYSKKVLKNNMVRNMVMHPKAHTGPKNGQTVKQPFFSRK